MLFPATRRGIELAAILFLGSFSEWMGRVARANEDYIFWSWLTCAAERGGRGGTDGVGCEGRQR